MLAIAGHLLKRVIPLVGAGIAAALASSASRPQRIEFPPPQPTPPPRITRDDFVGAEACRDCHQRQYDAWASSTHGRAGGAPDPDLIIAPFDGRPIRFRDAIVTPRIADDHSYEFVVERDGRNPLVFRVDGVIGGAHMQGGGTQGFVTRFPDGTVRFLPFDYARRERTWFCNTSDIAGWWTVPASQPRVDRGWIPITEKLAIAECGDWPPVRVLGTNDRFANCQNCHGSQITFAYDSSAHEYETQFTSLTIDCESCHGPGRAHVALATRGELEGTGDPRIHALHSPDKVESLRPCFTCHAVKHALRPRHLPGEPLEEFYSLKAPLVSENPFLPDGRIRTFAYQQNHVASNCFLNGSMTCADCHDPHGQGYRDLYGQELSDRFDDGQCLGCHASKAGDVSAHSHHPAASAGSRCVACHMPYLQHPEVGDAIRFARSDHTISIPRPAFDAQMGIETACSTCHASKTVTELQAQTDAWYGAVKPHSPIVSALTRAERGIAVPMIELLQPDTWNPLIQAAALSHFIEHSLSPDMANLDSSLAERLRRLTDYADLDVRAMALAALHLARGEQPATRTFLIHKLNVAGERDAAVRYRWLQVLRFYGDKYMAQRRGRDALAVYRKALEVLPDHAGTLLDLASAHAADGNHEAALQYYGRALEIDPTQSTALVNMGVALEQLGRRTEATAAYERAISVNPTEALAHFNLGNAHFEAGEYPQAIARYRRAVSHAPQLADAHFLLAQSLLFVDQPDSAILALRSGLEFDPDHAGARIMLNDLLERRR